MLRVSIYRCMAEGLLWRSWFDLLSAQIMWQFLYKIQTGSHDKVSKPVSESQLTPWRTKNIMFSGYRYRFIPHIVKNQQNLSSSLGVKKKTFYKVGVKPKTFLLFNLNKCSFFFYLNLLSTLFHNSKISNFRLES